MTRDGWSLWLWSAGRAGCGDADPATRRGFLERMPPMKAPRTVAVVLLCLLVVGTAWGLPSVAEGRPTTNKAALERLSLKFEEQFRARRGPLYLQFMQSTDPAWKALHDSPDIELMYVDERGIPHFYKVDNLNAAKTVSTDDVWTGGSGGYYLSGLGTAPGKLGIWDGGAVLTTHQEFTGRVTQKDGGGTSSHATHVAGTMVARGMLVPAAKGMSYGMAYLDAYNWTSDESEMASAAAAGMNVSNHSYGYATGWELDGDWYWHGDMSVSTDEDYMFGFYDDHTRDWDEIAYNAPYYTIVISAGNDRNDNCTGGHYHLEGGSWVWANDSHDPDGDYDCLGSPHTAKNAIIVGAVEDIPAGYSQPSDVVLTSFTSWGPTDDGRIKPDIVANGDALYSCTNTGNSDYATKSGTSMSAPNCSGSLNLLVRHYEDTHGGTTPLSSTMKAVLVQTADEAGSNPGPDYEFGWGLMNTLHAADLIALDSTDPGRIREDTLPPDVWVTSLFFFDASGSDPVRVTLAWTDPPGTPPPPSVDPADLMLVNDFDLRLQHLESDTRYEPYVLDPSNPSNAATTGDNFRDNVEQIYIASPPAGIYLATVSTKGPLSGGHRSYSLVASEKMRRGLPVPATSRWGLLVLASFLAVAGTVALSRRRRIGRVRLS